MKFYKKRKIFFDLDVLFIITLPIWAGDELQDTISDTNSTSKNYTNETIEEKER